MTHNWTPARLLPRQAKSFKPLFSQPLTFVSIWTRRWVNGQPHRRSSPRKRQGGRAGTGQPVLAVFGSLFGCAAIKRPRYCATQQGAQHGRWKPHGLVSAYQAVNKTRWDAAVGPGAPFPFPHSPALQKQIRREGKSVQPVFPLPSPRCCCTTPPPSLTPSLPPCLSVSLSHAHTRTHLHIKTHWHLCLCFIDVWKLCNSNIHYIALSHSVIYFHCIFTKTFQS